MAFGVALCKFQLNSANDFLHSHFFATKSVHFLFSSHSRIHVAIAIPYLAKSIMQIRKTLHCVPWTFSSSCKLHIYSALCHTTATQLSNFTWLNTCSCQSTMTPKKKKMPNVSVASLNASYLRLSAQISSGLQPNGVRVHFFHYSVCVNVFFSLVCLIVSFFAAIVMCSRR